VDVVASRGKHGLYIEAKGVTSSKELSTRFGKVQNSSQIFIQTATALLRCAELRSGNTDADVCIAIPDHDSFRKRIERIEAVLKASRIGCRKLESIVDSRQICDEALDRRRLHSGLRA